MGRAITKLEAIEKSVIFEKDQKLFRILGAPIILSSAYLQLRNVSAANKKLSSYKKMNVQCTVHVHYSSKIVLDEIC